MNISTAQKGASGYAKTMCSQKICPARHSYGPGSRGAHWGKLCSIVGLCCKPWLFAGSSNSEDSAEQAGCGKKVPGCEGNASSPDTKPGTHTGDTPSLEGRIT